MHGIGVEEDPDDTAAGFGRQADVDVDVGAFARPVARFQLNVPQDTVALDLSSMTGASDIRLHLMLPIQVKRRGAEMGLVLRGPSSADRARHDPIRSDPNQGGGAGRRMV